MRITFFRSAKPKQFNYIPRYYDEQKEEFEERKKRIEAELGVNNDQNTFQSQIKMGAMGERLQSRRKTNRASSLRLLIIIAILGLLALFLLRDVGSLSDLIK